MTNPRANKIWIETVIRYLELKKAEWIYCTGCNTPLNHTNEDWICEVCNQTTTKEEIIASIASEFEND